jgi:hypothetical protein
MDVALNITGRKALAVWTVPYVTSWRLSPDMMLERLNDARSRFPIAFNLDNSGLPCAIPSAQWDELNNLIMKLEHDLTNLNLPEIDNRKKWLKQSIEEFWEYESSYIWLDEFEYWYEQFIKNTWASEENENTALCLNPSMPKTHAQFFMNTELSRFRKSKPIAEVADDGDTNYNDIKPPLSRKAKVAQDARVLKNGAATISLRDFVDSLLVRAIGDDDTLPSFYSLVEDNGLVIYDKVRDGEIVQADELLTALRQRERQAIDSFEEDNFYFWATLNKESRYSVYRDDVANAYQHAGESYFPWFDCDGKLVRLSFLKPNNQAAGINTATPPKQLASNTKDNEPLKPWLIVDPKDPPPKQPWYTSARYFARQLVIADSGLLSKRNLLAAKVVKSLTGVRIYKRGGEKPLNASTVLKAFTKVNLG